MPNVNKAIVMGMLCRNPETKNLPNVGSVTNFGVAKTDKGGRPSKCYWINPKIYEITKNHTDKTDRT